MAGNNGHEPTGHTPALAFEAKKEIPIIGQPFAIKGWFPTVLLICNCEAKHPLMVPRGAAAQCPGCKKLYTIQQIAFRNGDVHFGIGVMTPEAAAEMLGAVETGGIRG